MRWVLLLFVMIVSCRKEIGSELPNRAENFKIQQGTYIVWLCDTKLDDFCTGCTNITSTGILVSITNTSATGCPMPLDIKASGATLPN